MTIWLYDCAVFINRAGILALIAIQHSDFHHGIQPNILLRPCASSHVSIIKISIPTSRPMQVTDNEHLILCFFEYILLPGFKFEDKIQSRRPKQKNSMHFHTYSDTSASGTQKQRQDFFLPAPAGRGSVIRNHHHLSTWVPLAADGLRGRSQLGTRGFAMRDNLGNL
jgi:hypothetical protein